MITKPIRKSIIDSMIRVDHAGEYGALGIYKGQLVRRSVAQEEIRQMYEHELEHFHYFDQEMLKRKVRPTLMMPLWKIGSFGIGALSATLGVRGMMMCTKAVESVIVKHYEEQVSLLNQTQPKEEELQRKISQFCDDELQHQNQASNHLNNIPTLSTLSVFGKCVKRICSAAIQISKHI